MRQTLENFFKALRSSGIDISVAESLDAVQAVRLVGLNQRETLKSALSLCIAKTLEDKERFGDFSMFTLRVFYHSKEKTLTSSLSVKAFTNRAVYWAIPPR